MGEIRLIVFDMAGTTVQDHNEVLRCFFAAADATGLKAEAETVNAMMGLPKRQVFLSLWKAQIGPDHPEYLTRVDQSYAQFRDVLENHYQTQPVHPTEGCLELFSWLKSQGIKIALTTGFYREVTDIILSRLGWDQGLDSQSVGSADALIQISVTPSEIYGNEGRPAPFMIQKAMYRLGVTDPQTVIAIGDTPSDLAAGKNAHCRYSVGVVNGSHSREQLNPYPNDGLFDSLSQFHHHLEMLCAPSSAFNTSSIQ
jgi:phosphonatase-like hydrolase